MRPAAKVWNRIEARLNRRRRWVFFTSGFFLLTASLFGYLIIDNSKQPSDPFSGLRTIQQKTTASATPIAGSSKINTITSASPLAIQTKHIAFSPDLKPTELFQKPMLAVTSNPSPAAGNVTSEFIPTPLDEIQPYVSPATTSIAQASTGHTALPLSIESVVNTYHPKIKRYKSEFQLFFTPTISYRRLTENKSYLQAVPRNLASYRIAALYDVNNMVTHKPDMGLELGFAFKFPVSSRVKLRSGMQFNITRYSIKAFTYQPELTTIALNNGSRGVNSLNTFSTYRNGSGTNPDWLQNFYFQASAPLGIEFASQASKKWRT